MTQKSRRKTSVDNRKAGNIDAHVGKRLRQRRIIRGLSQEELASRLGISPQQLHKYEIGQNRIAAARLYQCAQALDVPVSSFYIGLPEPSSLRDEKGLQASPPVPTGDVGVEETGHLSRVISGIDDPKLRRKIVELSLDAFAGRLRKLK